MRVFVADGARAPLAVDLPEGAGLGELQQAVQERLGVAPPHQFLATLGGKPLRHGTGAAGLYGQGVRQYDTLQLNVRLLGGQPVKVKLLTPMPKAECGTEVPLDVEPDTPMPLVKARLSAATGLPVRHMTVMLAGMGRLVALDRRSNLGSSASATTNNLYFATLPPTEAPSEQGRK